MEQVTDMLTLRWSLIAWAVAGPLLAGGVVYASMMAREIIVVAGAVKAARADEVSRCNERTRQIAETLNEASRQSVAAAVAAANAEKPTPEAQAEINALCKRSASCRDRGEMP